MSNVDNTLIQQLVTSSGNLVRAVNALNQTIAKVFPQAIGTATTATGGSATLPADPVGFLSVTNPVDGTTVKIPFYGT